MKRLWLTFVAISAFGLLLGLWLLPSGAGNSAGGSYGLLIALVVLAPLCLVTMHRLRKKEFKVE